MNRKITIVHLTFIHETLSLSNDQNSDIKRSNPTISIIILIFGIIVIIIEALIWKYDRNQSLNALPTSFFTNPDKI